VVLASVNLTQADDGFIILKEGAQLFVRVVKRKGERYTDHHHTETSDSVAWQVIRSGRPAMLHRETKIATGFLVRALLYVPLDAPDAGTMGVLGVVNRERDEPFSEGQLFTLSTLGDFAAIALENARLFASREAERSRLSGILEHATEAIIVTDPRNRLWLWSDTAAHMFELDAQARGRLLDDYVDNQDIRSLFSQAQPAAGVSHTEVTLEDGRVLNAQLSTIATIGHVVVMQDITHLKELDRLKSEFVSTVSHDLRTPLTTIQGYVELLDRAGPLNEMQVDFVSRALNSLTHITALISDLLDIGRIEAGYDLQMRRLRLDELICTAVEGHQAYALNEGQALTVQLPDGPLQVLGDERRLHQVLDNLISNAIKYNRPEGWVRVSASRDDHHIIVRVSDSGIGIPPEEEARIFDRFYRIQSPETESVQGTGLGLSIVKSVIEKHKGRIWVDSTLGEGSTFTFLLPAADATD
jgi:two-component system, OmpR family, phosphate regulon sensor histidine kinase PhoR